MGIAPAGVKFDNTGHHHLLIDTDVPADLSQAAAGDRQDRALRQGPDRDHAHHADPGQAHPAAAARRHESRAARPAGDLEEDHHHGRQVRRGERRRHDARRPARRHGCVLRIRRAARRSRARRQAGDRRLGGRARRGRGGQLRGAPLRRALGDADAHRAAAVPARGVRAPAHGALPGSLARRCSACSARSRRWCRACRSTRRSSTSPPASSCWATRSTSRAASRRASASSPGSRASVGVAPNKLVAKIASDLDKPDGLTVVSAERVREVLDPLSVRRLPGLGRKTGARGRGGRDPHLRRAAQRPGCGAVAAVRPLLPPGCASAPPASTTARCWPDVEDKSLSAEDTFERRHRRAAHPAAPAGAAGGPGRAAGCASAS